MLFCSLSPKEDKATALGEIFIEVEEAKILELKIVDLLLFYFFSFI